MSRRTGGCRPPTAAEVQRRLQSPGVIITRPIIVGSIGVLRVARRFGWHGEGLHHLESLPSPFVLAANHQSHADTPAVLGTLPRAVAERTAVAAALDVFGNGSVPSLKRECLQLVVAAGFHAFAFDRHGPPLRSLRTAVGLTRNGWNLLIYPEGTRSRSGRMGRFKEGVGVLAKLTGHPVVPVNVQGGRGVLPCGAFVPRAGRITVCYGRALRFEAGETVAGFTARLEDAVRNAGRAARVPPV